MAEDEFIEIVRREAPLESLDATRVTAATLETLGERITDGTASDLAQQLPETVGDRLIDAPGEAETFPLEEFTARVSDRAGVDTSDTVASARAVVTAVSMEAPALERAREQLPTEFDVIFEPGGPITADEFTDTVRTRASVDSDSATRDAIDATLRTLGDRLSQGEAADLALYLPDSFEDRLLESDEQATAYSVEEFTQRVAQREGVEPETATTHVRAVCSTLAETASERELSAAKKQLPDPFGVIFEPPNEAE